MSNFAVNTYVSLQHDVCRISLPIPILKQHFYQHSCLLFLCVRTLTNIYFKQLLVSNRVNNKKDKELRRKYKDNNFTKRQGGNVSWCLILSASLRQRQVAVMHRDKEFFNFYRQWRMDSMPIITTEQLIVRNI